MDQQAENACGYHGYNLKKEPIFDYTCDDCMLPWNHYDPPNNAKTIQTDTKRTQKSAKVNKWFSDLASAERQLLQKRTNRNGRSKRNDGLEQQNKK